MKKVLRHKKRKVTNNNIYLLVGLGNPGEKYESTRHNIGFSFLDSYSKQIQCPILDTKFDSYYGNFSKDGNKILLLKPQTFMNESGLAVKKAKNFFKINDENIIIIYDDLDLQVGQIKIKFSGGSGGHNGLNNIIEKIGSRDFWRLRVGIDKPQDREQTIEYVLGKPSPQENE